MGIISPQQEEIHFMLVFIFIIKEINFNVNGTGKVKTSMAAKALGKRERQAELCSPSTNTRFASTIMVLGSSL